MSKNKDQKTFEKSNFYTFSDSGWGFFLATVAPYAVALVIMLIASMAQLKSGSIALGILSLFASPIAFSSVFFGYNKYAKISIKAAKVKFKIKAWDFVMCFVIALVAVFGLMYFIGGLDSLLRDWGYNFSEIPLPMDNFGWLVLAIILLAVLPAIFEELVFRGMILNGLRSSMGEIAAIFASAALFSIMHGSIQQLIYPFILGIILGWVAVRTGSTVCSMIVHFLNNAVVIIVQYVQFHTGNMQPIVYNTGAWLLAVALVIVTAIVIYLIEKFYFKHKNRDEEEMNIDSQENKVSHQKNKTAKSQPVPFIMILGVIISLGILVANTYMAFTNVTGG